MICRLRDSHCKTMHQFFFFFLQMTLNRQRSHVKPRTGLWQRFTHSPGFWEFCKSGQTAGVHVSAYINVHRGIGLGELCRCGDALVTQGRHR